MFAYSSREKEGQYSHFWKRNPKQHKNRICLFPLDQIGPSAHNMTIHFEVGWYCLIQLIARWEGLRETGGRSPSLRKEMHAGQTIVSTEKGHAITMVDALKEYSNVLRQSMVLANTVLLTSVRLSAKLITMERAFRLWYNSCRFFHSTRKTVLLTKAKRSAVHSDK